MRVIEAISHSVRACVCVCGVRAYTRVRGGRERSE